MTAPSTLRDLLINKVNVLYDMEHELAKAVPKIIRATTNEDLKKEFTEHLGEIKTHIKRLEQVHKLLGVKPKKLTSAAIRGLVEDANWVIKNINPAAAKDANLARAAEYMEHYEMAGYIGAVDWAKTCGEKEVAKLLKETLKEEEKGDKKLQKIEKKLDEEID